MPQAAALHQEKLPWGAEPPAGAPHLQESWAPAAWAHGTAVAAQHKGLRLGAGAQAAATACPGGTGCRHFVPVGDTTPARGPTKQQLGCPRGTGCTLQGHATSQGSCRLEQLLPVSPGLL